MKVVVEKEAPWSNRTHSSPAYDVRRHVAENAFASVTLYLTVDSVRELFAHPDTCAISKWDWKYAFQVDDVRMSEFDYDYLEFGQ